MLALQLSDDAADYAGTKLGIARRLDGDVAQEGVTVSQRNRTGGSRAQVRAGLMLRSNELLGAHRTELFDFDGEHPRFDVPLKRVKKRRVIQHSLSDLAVEIIREGLTSDKQRYVFASPLGDQPMNRRVARKRGRLRDRPVSLD